MALSIDVAGTGLTVLDRVYTDERRSFEALGGSCGNVLVSLAMLDHMVTPVLRLGYDDVGASLVAEFASAGADTTYIFRRADVASPVIAQRLDTSSGQHSFSFICPETDKNFPQYCSIDEADVESAKDAFGACSIFYSDRVSEPILQAMAAAFSAGALIYFEPSTVEDEALFQRALGYASIVKFSSDRLDLHTAKKAFRPTAISIVTHGSDGLEVHQDDKRIACQAKPAAIVRDACGAGDMVTVGLIDWILNRRSDDTGLSVEQLLPGVFAGQRLAACNCAFPGARGIFQHRGAKFARSVLEDDVGDSLLQFDLFEDL